MLHIGRCGSSVIGRMLNAHPRIYWAGEIFEDYSHGEKDTDRDEFVKQLYYPECRREITRVFGFETKYLPQQHLSGNCINMELGEYITLLRKIGVTRFIVLHRRNYLRHTISFLVGAQTKQWHSSDRATSPTRVHIDVNNLRTEQRRQPLLQLFHDLDEEYNKLQRLLAEDDVLYLIYEEDVLENPAIAYRKICRFLGVSEESPGIELQRTNPFSYREMVDNFDEVEAALAGTRYGWMLND